jgi:hypothetical protein
MMLMMMVSVMVVGRSGGWSFELELEELSLGLVGRLNEKNGCCVVRSSS